MGRGWVSRGGGPSGSLNKVGYRSVTSVNTKNPGQDSPYMNVRRLIITKATRKKLICVLLETHMCFISKRVITSNLHSQITTRKAGRETSKALKNKIHKSESLETVTKL